MKIVILTSETPGNVWLVNQILARHEVAGIVIERRPLAHSAETKRERRRQMIRKHGLWRTANKLLYNRVRAAYELPAEARTLREAFFPDGAPIEYERRVPTMVVPSVNAPEAIAFISSHGPDLLAVCGTTVLKPAVFTLAPRGAINIHTGITPEYRSADPVFWALYHGDVDKVGVTVHYIDAGIDTGAVIHQATVPVYREDTLAAISARCVRRGAALYLQALTEIANGSVTTSSRPGVAGRSFYSINLGLIQYLRFRWRFRRLAPRLPSRRTANSPAVTELG